jgi:putative membrane protein
LVERVVSELEAKTDAEIIVVAAGRSGQYRDVTYGVASVATLLTLVVLELIPYPVHPWLLPFELAAAWGLTAWVASGWWFLRLMTPESRRREQVRTAAYAEFTQENVHATPHRTGVLVYVSAFEGLVEVLPDLGLQGRIPGPAWQEVRDAFRHDDLDHFLGGLAKLGSVLETHVPPLTVDLVDLPNAPRVRP